MEISDQLHVLFTLDNLLFIIIGIAGMAGHGIKKFYQKQLSTTLTDYYWNNNKKRTLLAVATTIGALMGVVLGDQLPDKIGAWILLAFSTGYMSDSSINKDGEK